MKNETHIRMVLSLMLRMLAIIMWRQAFGDYKETNAGWRQQTEKTAQEAHFAADKLEHEDGQLW